MLFDLLRLAGHFAAGSLLGAWGERARVNRWSVSGSVAL
jgi:hypothetical protein